MILFMVSPASAARRRNAVPLTLRRRSKSRFGNTKTTYVQNKATRWFEQQLASCRELASLPISDQVAMDLRLHIAAPALLFAGLLQAGDPPRPYSISANSRLVMVPVTVTDRSGRSIIDLQKGQFRIFEDAEPREIHSFVREEAPVSVGLVIDSSGSMHHKLPHAIAAVRAITAEIGPADAAFLMTFAEKPVMEYALTRNFHGFADRLRATGAMGGTALFDAVYSALHEIRAASPGRKALVVVSDGGDNHSRFRKSELMQRAVEADTQIYSVSIVENL